MIRIISSNKTLGHLFFLVLGILAVIFCLERSTFIDPAWVIFKLTTHQTFQPEAGRYAAILPQALPLAGILMHLPLKTILFLYSVSFVLIYYCVFLIIAHIFKNGTIALAVPLALMMGINESYFWISTETQQTLAYDLLLFSFLYYANSQPAGILHPLKNTLLAVMILLLCFFTHPVSLFTVLFLLGYFLIDKKTWKSPVIYLLGLLITGMAIYKVIITPAGGYEIGFIQSFLSITDNISTLGDSKSFQFIGDHILTHYLPSGIMLIAIIVVYIRNRKYLKLTYFLLSSALFLLIVFTTFNNWYYPFIQEKNIMPFNLFLLIPFLKDVTFTSHRLTLSKQAFIVFIFLFSLSQILAASVSVRQRQKAVQRLIEQSKVYPGKKFFIDDRYLEIKSIKVTWAMPFETLILSSLDHPDSARSIYITNNNEDLAGTLDLSDTSLFLSYPSSPRLFRAGQLNAGYFNPAPSSYRFLSGNDLFLVKRSRLIYRNTFDDLTFTFSNDHCVADSGGKSCFLLTQETSPGLRSIYSDVIDEPTVLINAAMRVYPLTEVNRGDLQLVISRMYGEEVWDYFTSFSDPATVIRPGIWNQVTVSGIIREAKPNHMLKVYLWNPRKHHVKMDDFVITCGTE